MLFGMMLKQPPNFVSPAKAATQIHPERLAGFIWAPAFAGETDVVDRVYPAIPRAAQAAATASATLMPSTAADRMPPA